MIDQTRICDPDERDWNVLVAGLPQPKSVFELAPGICLSPLRCPLSVFDLAAAGAVGFRCWSLLEPVAPMCTCELKSGHSARVRPGYNTLNRAWLASALLVLRGFTRHICIACSSYSWNTIAGRERFARAAVGQESETKDENAEYSSAADLPKFSGDVLDFRLKLITNKSAEITAVSVDDADWISSHFEIFNELATQSDPFRFALEAATDWRFATDARSAVARLWTGIEAIFGISSELVYRISLLSANLLADAGTARKEKFNKIKTLYSLRSKVVHGERVSEKQIEAALDDSFRLLADLLLLGVNRGHPLGKADFDEAMFG